jgi:uncharacterized membrane protein YeaQ/YmgE (transglycosylase-associated protein family)
MNFLIWLIVGGIVGWLASLIMRTDAQQGILLNVAVGIVGAVIAGALLPRLGFFPGGDIIGQIISATIGAVGLLVLIGVVRRAA